MNRKVRVDRGVNLPADNPTTFNQLTRGCTSVPAVRIEPLAADHRNALVAFVESISEQDRVFVDRTSSRR